MSFETVFDVSREGFRAWWSLVPFVGVAAIGLVLSTASDVALRRTGRVLAVIGVAVAVVVEYAAYMDYRALKIAVEQGRFTSVEGTVVDFVPGGADGHPPESFCVSGHCSSYSPAMISADFNRVSGRGGRVRAGQIVRIADVGGRIARLEIERTATAR
jgi:hypothetical protein